MLLPMTKAKVGEPAVVLSVTASLNVMVALRVSMSFSSLTLGSRGLATPPEELLKTKLARLGKAVSIDRLEKAPALPLLPAASW